MRRNLRKIGIALLSTMILGIFSGCGNDAGKATSSTSGKAGSPLRYTLGTSSTGGNFYLVGGGIATLLNNALKDSVVVTAEETGGSTANLTMIQNGEADLGIAMTSSLHEGLQGKAKWTKGKPIDKVRGLAPLYPSYLTMYSLKSTGVTKLTDFNGKVVGLGSKGAAMDSVLRQAFEKLGIKPGSIFNDGHGATAQAVSNGQVDVAVLFSYPPFAAITELEASKELNFIGLTDDEQQKLCAMYPFYSPAVMPKGSYKGLPADIKTVTEWNMLIVSKEVPNDLAYQMAKTIFENNPKLLEIYKGLSYAKPENCVNFNVPLHPGTIKYLKEKGIQVPEKLVPAEYKE